MNATQGNMLLSLRNVQGFLQSNASQLAAVIATGVNTRLNAAITALTGHATHLHDFFSSLLSGGGIGGHTKPRISVEMRGFCMNNNRVWCVVDGATTRCFPQPKLVTRDPLRR